MTLRRTRHAVLAATLATTFTLSHAALASPQEGAKDEIDHLLQYVAASQCTFLRNGSEYPAQKARDHLEDKYRFAGSRIATAEEFIAYLATKSSFSGQPYHVRCGKDDELSGAWLTAELKRYRNALHTASASR
jgi:uncharacterized protein DUF5329